MRKKFVNYCAFLCYFLQDVEIIYHRNMNWELLIQQNMEINQSLLSLITLGIRWGKQSTVIQICLIVGFSIRLYKIIRYICCQRELAKN